MTVSTFIKVEETHLDSKPIFRDPHLDPISCTRKRHDAGGMHAYKDYMLRILAKKPGVAVQRGISGRES